MVPRNSLLVVVFLSVFSFVTSEAENFGKSYLEDITISARDKEILDIFTKRVSSRLRVPYMKKEFFLIRWLRARNFDLDDAERMLSDHLKWWDVKKMDTIGEEDWTDINRDFPIYFFSDKEGRPVLYLDFGDWDVRKAAVTGTVEQLIRYLGMVFESGFNYVRKLGKQNQNVTQSALIINNAGFNVITHGCLQCLPFVLCVITLYETHFPGYLNKIIVVNSPAIAEVIADAARRLFHPETQRIFRVYGRNKKQWEPVLEKYFDQNELPVDLGGFNEPEEFSLERIRDHLLPI